MNKLRLIAVTLLLTLFNINSIVFAKELNHDIAVEASYIRATIPGTDITSAYMTIKNDGQNNVTLIGASSSVSDRIEIHQHLMDNGMMKMRQVEQLVINGKGQVVLQPMGYHLMIFKVKSALLPKDEVAITLHFKQQKDVVITIPVQGIKQKTKAKKQHHHH